MKIIPFTEVSRPRYPIGENVIDAIQYIDLITPYLKEIVKNKGVNIWCSGSSGAILSAFLVKNLDNHCLICHVKKEGEHAHHGNSFSKVVSDDSINIILDDFMRSGETIERIYEQAKNYCKKIDVLVLANCYQEKWRLSFIPDIFIVDGDSIHSSWNDENLITEKESSFEQFITINF